VAGFCKHGRLLFDKLNNYQLFKEYPAPWSKCLASRKIYLFENYLATIHQLQRFYSAKMYSRTNKNCEKVQLPRT
jgi:hypothetical protein